MDRLHNSLLDEYRESPPNKSFHKTARQNTWNKPSSRQPSRMIDNIPNEQLNRLDEGQEGKTTSRPVGECFFCHKVGNWKKDCYSNPDNPNNRLKANSVRTTSRKTTSKKRDSYLNSSGRELVILTTKIKGRTQEFYWIPVQVLVMYV